MIRTYGSDALVSLVKSYAGGRTDDEAFTAALGLDMTAFSTAWFKSVNATPKTKFGPQPAPAGPVPSAWSGAAPGGATGSAAPGAPAAPGATASASPGSTPAADSGTPGWLILGLVAVARRGRRSRAAGRRWPPPTTEERRAVTVMRRIRAIPSWQVTLGVALLALGFLIAAQLASEGPRVRYTTQERTPLVETANELQTQQDGLKAQILDLRAKIQTIETQGQGSADLVGQLNAAAPGGAHLRRSDRADGDRDRPPARGFGDAGPARRKRVRLPRRVARHPVSWSSSCGARAPRRSRSTANGSRRPRRSSTSAPRCWSTRRISRRPTRSPPSALPDLYDRLSKAQGFIDFLHARSAGYGIRVSVAEPASVDVPAFVGTVTLRYSRPLASPSGAPSARPSASPGGG